LKSDSSTNSGIKIENGVPAIISEKLFNAVQIEIAKNAHAPARHTADEDYLLTTKLFCGKCGAMMVAQAGTSSKGPIYRYYACVRQKKHLCDKKMVSKTKLPLFAFINKKTYEIPGSLSGVSSPIEAAKRVCASRRCARAAASSCASPKPKLIAMAVFTSFIVKGSR